MMEYYEFKQGLMSALNEAYGFDYHIEERTVEKPNLGAVDAIQIKKGNSGVLLYPEELYAQYSAGRTIDNMVKGYEKAIYNLPEQQEIDTSRGAILDKVFYKMVGISGNESYLADKPYTKVEGFDDIALIPCMEVEVSGHKGVTIFTNKQIALAGISPGELHAAASANTDNMIRFRSMGEVLAELMPWMDREMLDSSPLYVANDSEMERGAAPLGAPSVLKEIQAKLGDHYVIPSSIHEVIAVSKEDVSDLSHLQYIVGECNSTAVAPGEKLADSVYESKGGKYVTHSFGAGAEAGAESAMRDSDGLANYGPRL